MIMAAACLASFTILAGGLAALYGLSWYKNTEIEDGTRGAIEYLEKTKTTGTNISRQLHCRA